MALLGEESGGTQHNEKGPKQFPVSHSCGKYIRNRKSPPKLGGVAAPLRKYRASDHSGADGVVPKLAFRKMRFRNHPVCGTKVASASFSYSHSWKSSAEKGDREEFRADESVRTVETLGTKLLSVPLFCWHTQGPHGFIVGRRMISLMKLLGSCVTIMRTA